MSVSATERYLIGSELDLIDVLDALDAPVIISRLPHGSGQATTVYLNDAMAQLVGCDARDLLGKSPEVWQGGAMDRGDVMNLASALGKGERVTMRCRIADRGHDEVVVEVTMTPHVTSDALYVVNAARRVEESEAPALDLRDELHFKDVTLDRRRREVRRGGQALDLTPTEFLLMDLFMTHQEVVLSRRDILARVWGFRHETRSHVVDVYVGYLRRKLEAVGPRLIYTVRGAGYILKDPEQDAP